MKDILLNLSQVLFSCLLIGSAGALAARLTRRWIDTERPYLAAWIFVAVSLGSLTLILGLFHMLYKTVFVVLWSVVLGFGAPALLSDIRRHASYWRSSVSRCSLTEKIFLGLFVVRTAIIFLGGTLILPWGGAESDALHYHLVLPRMYMAQHSMAPLEWSIPDKYPLLFHMLYLSGYSLLGPLFAKTLIFLAALGGDWIVYRMALRCARRFWALLAMIVFGSIPAIVIQNGTAMIDLLSLFFMLAALEGLWIYSESGEKPYLWCSALAAGIIASARVFTVIFAAMFAGMTVLILLRRLRSLRSASMAAAAYGLIVGCVYFPWLLRSYILTGNPVFPLAFHWLGGAGMDAGRDSALAYVQWAYGLGKSVKALALLPWNMTFHSLAFDYPIGPLWLALLPLVLLYCPWRKVYLPAIAAVLFTILWFIGSQQTRYFYFSLAVFSVFLAAALERMDRTFHSGAQIIAALLGLNVLLSCAQAQRQYAVGWRQLSHLQSNESLLKTWVKHASSLQIVKETVPVSARVLLLDSWPEYLYYFPRDFRQGGRGILATNYWDAHQQSPDSLVLKMRQHQIQYLVSAVTSADLNVYITAGRGKLVGRDDSYVIYQLNLN